MRGSETALRRGGIAMTRPRKIIVTGAGGFIGTTS